jgi:hypothetical protein
MGKQHETFPGEQPEMPVPVIRPEVGQPKDPVQPEVPQEDPQLVPDEFPPETDPGHTPQEPETGL